MVLRFKKIWFSTFFSLIVLFSVGQTISKGDTLKLLVIGNSFSHNATRYLKSLAEEGGYTDCVVIKGIRILIASKIKYDGV